MRGQALGDGGGDRRAAEPRVLHVLEVGRGEIGVVEQARHVVRRATADAQATGFHQGQHHGRVPDVGQVDRLAPQHRGQQGAEHAHEVADRGGRELLAPVVRVPAGELADLEAERLVAVDDALGVPRGPGRERDQGGLGRVGGDRVAHRAGGEKLVEVLAHHADDRHRGGQVRLRLAGADSTETTARA
ncbi:MAG TPA: hypothetical protein VKG80_05270 [Trebonia sp.]|nr:hypothetical protein [Trebonia sp.]